MSYNFKLCKTTLVSQIEGEQKRPISFTYKDRIHMAMTLSSTFCLYSHKRTINETFLALAITYCFKISDIKLCH